MSDNKRIAKNTLYMYFRMFITMCVGIYTSRVILRVLGVEDYGLYNVIGGIVAMFGFLNNAMANATSRFLTFTLGKGDEKKENETFCMAILIHLGISFIIVVLAETIGLWYLHNKLVVPDGRMYAAEWLYQLTILTTVLNIMTVPFNAVIIAHERMSAFAYISIMDVFLKLIIVVSLQWVTYDKLIVFGTLMFCILLLDGVVYVAYCYRKFSYLRFRYYFNKKQFQNIFSFAGWNMFGTFCFFFYSQGLNLIINLFCGPAVNAARGIASQVESIVKQFAYNVQTAINPQIIKSYAQDNLQRVHTLIYASTRYCYFLLFLIAFPIMLEAPFILDLWLGNYPEHTVSFLRITLACVVLDTFINPLWTANNATGKVKYYTIILSGLAFAFMPITYFSIYFTKIPEIVFLCYLLMTCCGIVLRWFILRKAVRLSIKSYLKETLWKILIVTFVSVVLSILVYWLVPVSIIGNLLVMVISCLIILFCCFLMGINNEERKLVLTKIKSLSKLTKRNEKLY